MTVAPDQVGIARLPADFDRWNELLALILDAFAYMNGIIDPPSSAHQLTPENLAAKADSETVFLATAGEELLGCVFAAEKLNHFYVGKLAVAPAAQGAGIGKHLLGAVEQFARESGKPILELQTRIELTGNQMAFGKLGFVETSRTAHEGFDRPTSITMRKMLG
ncbi:GNAT superfamily N-acetyltransferase [Mesorhizobium soli]|uniref:GNAT family N-acetyltransferase n=1 Tax=Pseudaminobacter soli (ex Li et al. 2025) TaxID=1295366 RepID=UPI002476F1AE|nr:GNAT family N-acetyltransferase [Mesorhizobium soli]MDH6230985.1 GNAT superfamily N-acetyltransferase [Mesorhizobium soli]